MDLIYYNFLIIYYYEQTYHLAWFEEQRKRQEQYQNLCPELVMKRASPHLLDWRMNINMGNCITTEDKTGRLTLRVTPKRENGEATAMSVKGEV